MDASMQLKIVLGTAVANGNKFSPLEKVQIIRHLSSAKLVRHLRGFEPMPTLLKSRRAPHDRECKSIHAVSLCIEPDSLASETCIRLYSDFNWDPYSARKRRRHDWILYLSKNGLLVLWSGDCQTIPEGTNIATMYDTLSIHLLGDARLAEFLGTKPTLFEELIEKLRVLQKKSLDRAEAAIREQRDALRRTAEIQRKMQLIPNKYWLD